MGSFAAVGLLRPRGAGEGDRDRLQPIQQGKPGAELLVYQYLQTLPLIAQGEANKVWIIPSDLQRAVRSVAGAVKDLAASPPSAMTDGQNPE